MDDQQFKYGPLFSKEEILHSIEEARPLSSLIETDEEFFENIKFTGKLIIKKFDDDFDKKSNMEFLNCEFPQHFFIDSDNIGLLTRSLHFEACVFGDFRIEKCHFQHLTIVGNYCDHLKLGSLKSLENLRFHSNYCENLFLNNIEAYNNSFMQNRCSLIQFFEFDDVYASENDFNDCTFLRCKPVFVKFDYRQNQTIFKSNLRFHSCASLDGTELSFHGLRTLAFERSELSGLIIHNSSFHNVDFVDLTSSKWKGVVVQGLDFPDRKMGRKNHLILKNIALDYNDLISAREQSVLELQCYTDELKEDKKWWIRLPLLLSQWTNRHGQSFQRAFWFFLFWNIGTYTITTCWYSIDMHQLLQNLVSGKFFSHMP